MVLGVPTDRRVVWCALCLIFALVVVDVVGGVVLVSTLGIVVVVVGLLASPRAVLVTGAVALLSGVLLVATVDRGDLGPLRVGNIVIGTLIAYGGAAARVRMERRFREQRLQAEAQAVRLEVVEHEHRRLFDELQAALVPPLPRLAELDCDVVYRPAGSRSPSGGDLHDVHVLPDGSLVVIVVDAMGHGVGSTRDALRVVAMARVLLERGTTLDALPDELDAYLNGAEDRRVAGSTLLDEEIYTHTVTATLTAARVEPSTGAVTVACAGHPPPLVVRSDGRADFVEASGPAIGYPRGAPVSVSRTVLAPGDSLVLYTDGLVEHARDIVAGMDRLAEGAGRALAGPAAGMAARLADAVTDAEAGRDDLLALALRRR